MHGDRAAVSSDRRATFDRLFCGRPVILAPMEDVTDAVFRGICRSFGAELCVTEFVNVEGLLRGCVKARHKVTLAPDDQPTAIQIYGSDAERLAEAVPLVQQAQPAFIDINCGCWVRRIAGKGAGAGWLGNPDAMVAMAAGVVRRASVPVTVKTRIGIGTEPQMPIVELARRLEDVGIRALTVHCRTARAGFSGTADWRWAGRVQQAVSIPVVVNGDIRGARDAARALQSTGCPAVMVGRRAMEHPWIFREARALLDRGEELPGPTVAERLALCRQHLEASVRQRGEPHGVRVTRRHLAGYVRGLHGAAALRRTLFGCETLAGCLQILDRAAERLLA